MQYIRNAACGKSVVVVVLLCCYVAFDARSLLATSSVSMKLRETMRPTRASRATTPPGGRRPPRASRATTTRERLARREGNIRGEGEILASVFALYKLTAVNLASLRWIPGELLMLASVAFSSVVTFRFTGRIFVDNGGMRTNSSTIGPMLWPFSYFLQIPGVTLVQRPDVSSFITATAIATVSRDGEVSGSAREVSVLSGEVSVLSGEV